MDRQLILKWNLEAIMIEKNLDIETVAKKTNIHRNIISKIKNNNQSRVDLETLERLINGLNVSPNELFKMEFTAD